MLSYKNKRLNESFDFNEVLNNDRNNLNDVIQTIQLTSIIDIIKEVLIKNTQVESIITYSLEKNCILIRHSYKVTDNITLVLSIIKVTLNNQKFIFDIYNCNDNISNMCDEYDDNYYNIINNKNIEIFEKLLYVVGIQNIKIGIVLTNARDDGAIYRHNSDLNNLPILQISGKVIKNNIMPFIKKGYKNIDIKSYYKNIKDINCTNTDNNATSVQYGNISIYNLAVTKIDKDIYSFIKYAKKYLIPSNGNILFLPDIFLNDKKNWETYWENIYLCKFTDTEINNAIKNNSIKITQKDIEIVYNKLRARYTNSYECAYHRVAETVQHIKENNISHFYARVALGCIFGCGTHNLGIFHKFTLFNENNLQYNPVLIKAYFNYIIDDIKNKGDIYQQIITLI